MQCTARTDYGQCRRQAVKGKDKCSFHGGALKIKNGLYSKYLTQTLRDRLEESMTQDARDLREEIGALRMLSCRAAELYGQYSDKGNGLEIESMHLWRSLMNDIRQTVESLSKVEDRDSITATQVQLILTQVSQAIMDVCDSSTQRKLLSRLKAIRIPSGALSKSALLSR